LYKNQNATEAFHRVGHSAKAKEKMLLYKIGELEHKVLNVIISRKQKEIHQNGSSFLLDCYLPTFTKVL
jgi:hypothetical protein